MEKKIEMCHCYHNSEQNKVLNDTANKSDFHTWMTQWFPSWEPVDNSSQVGPS